MESALGALQLLFGVKYLQSKLFFFLTKFDELVYTSIQGNHNTASLMQSKREDLHLKLKQAAVPSADRISVTALVPGGVSGQVLVLRLH